MPIQVFDIRNNHPQNIDFVSPIYIDENLFVSFPYRKHQKYSTASVILLEMISQNVEMRISTLAVDEFWHGLERELMRDQGTASFSDPTVRSIIRSRIKNVTLSILSLTNIRFLPDSLVNPMDTINTASDIYTQGTLKPRDCFHLALTMLSNSKGFITSDGDFEKIREIKLPLSSLETVYIY